MTEVEEKSASATPGDESATIGAPQVPIADIEQRGNVRDVDLSSVKELADSIRQVGVLEPVLLVRRPQGDTAGRRFDLVAGFRRVAAARLAGLKTVPAVIQDLTPEKVSEVRLIENLQREDLTELEEARALKAYLELTKATQEELGKRIGKSQPYVANRIRLLGLPEPVRVLIDDGKLSAAHGEALLGLKTDKPAAIETLAKSAVARGTTAHDLAWDVRSKNDARKRAADERAKLQRTINGAKFKTCPKCKQPAISIDRWSGSTADGTPLRDKNGHEWWSKTGKTTGGNHGGYTPRQVPSLPEVKVDLPCSASPDQVWRSIAPLATGVDSIHVSSRYGQRRSVEITIHVPDASAKLLAVPHLTMGRTKGTISLDGFHYQPTDKERKAAAEARADLELWMSTLRAPTKTKKSARAG